MSEPVRVLRLHPGARLPFRATASSSGWDLFARLDAPVTVGQQPVLVGTGLAMEVPPGIDAQIRPRSGLGRRGIMAVFGTLDADYRGELLVTLYAVAPGIAHTIEDGDRIAQIVFTRLAAIDFVEADSLAASERGVGGHGSTGR